MQIIFDFNIDKYETNQYFYTRFLSGWIWIWVLEHGNFLNTPQGSVATRLMCGGGMFNDAFIANLLVSPSVKEFWKSVRIWRSYGQNSSVLDDSRCIYSAQNCPFHSQFTLPDTTKLNGRVASSRAVWMGYKATSWGYINWHIATRCVRSVTCFIHSSSSPSSRNTSFWWFCNLHYHFLNVTVVLFFYTCTYTYVEQNVVAFVLAVALSSGCLT